ncbi:alpha/beta fold hydrolase [Simiduia agarivorans]|uniref:Alpha/beta fold family hydrolase n=1 Tax=Simiduia agarivorans (strain DSM 21679 / JCM 13881 / BCRC 17597 / SA1) TaxID=1117647 RepID=K4KHY2_SIMAS|nr:alpha/beta hydrolase [Simiduia agarivorans]AFU97578.1 alpha/beta fold family hydrolase [Simiduia agarivorans SA1 = DSM 21679]
MKWFVALVLALGCALWVFLRGPASVAPLPPDQRELVSVACWFETDQRWPEQCFQLHVTDAGFEFELPLVVLPGRMASANSEALLYLSGGPGGSVFISSDDIDYWRGLQDRLNGPLDLVLVDRRGTGLSAPLLQCDFASREYRRALSEDLNAFEESGRLFQAYQWCFERQLAHGPDAQKVPLQTLGTRADADDIQSLPALLGYEQWHLWGVSYGTRLAMQVALDQPAGLTSLVLDSVYPPGFGKAEEWPGLMQMAMHRFFQWCDNNACISDTDMNAETVFQQALHHLSQSPRRLELPSWYGDAPFVLMANDQRFLQIVFGAIYDPYLWPDIGASVGDIYRGDSSPALRGLAENFVNNAFDPSFSDLVFYAAECKDNALSDPDAIDTAVQQHPRYQRYMEGLAQWDVCQLPLFESLRGSESMTLDNLARIEQPVLLIAGEIDPITPVEWLAPVRALLPRWQQALFANEGHAVVASSLCAEQLLAQFIRSSAGFLTNSDEKCTGESFVLSRAVDAFASP